MEEFSLAYVHAVAAAAGFGLEHRRIDVDSVDVSIQDYGSVRSQIDIQSKCTALDEFGSGETIPFRLKAKNYDDLRQPLESRETTRLQGRAVRGRRLTSDQEEPAVTG